MSVFTVGGDLRYAVMTQLAAARSLDFAGIGFEACPLAFPRAAWHDLAHAEAVVLPNPWRTGLQTPYASVRPYTAEQLPDLIPQHTPILLSDASSLPAALRTRPVVDLSTDGEYIGRNAALTAEGAICTAAARSGRSLLGSECLVIGYGRIGSRLADLLRHMGASVQVAARRESVRAAIAKDGFAACSMENLPDCLPCAHFIFSTPPAQVLGEPLLRCISPDAVLTDLASPPYGFDLELARSLSLNAARENSLPGRYCPVSAGECLLEAVLRALNTHQKGASHAAD